MVCLLVKGTGWMVVGYGKYFIVVFEVSKFC